MHIETLEWIVIFIVGLIALVGSAMGAAAIEQDREKRQRDEHEDGLLP